MFMTVIAAMVAYYTGEARNFFLIQLLSNAASALAWIVSIVIGWPFLGVIVGGLIGTLMIGLVAAPETYNGVAGLFYGGGFDQLWRQAVGAGAVFLYCAIASTILALIVKFTVGLRLDEEDEATGADESEHAETGYDFATVGAGSTLGRHPGVEG